MRRMKDHDSTRRRDTVLTVCRHIDAHAEEPLPLAALAHRAGLSPWHLQRLFKRLIGISPREYQEARRLDAFKRHVRDGRPLADAAFAAGFGSSSRLYEKSARLGMTPARYRRGGAALVIRYTLFGSPLGRVLLAATAHGVCKVSLGGDDRALARELREELAAADCRRDDAALRPWREALTRYFDGAEAAALALPLDIRATAFQRRVWNILRRIPYGETLSYGEIAAKAGAPAAVRAVARAIATNPVALAIPCHRAIRKSGELAGYRWGVARKRALLARERGE